MNCEEEKNYCENRDTVENFLCVPVFCCWVMCHIVCCGGRKEKITKITLNFLSFNSEEELAVNCEKFKKKLWNFELLKPVKIWIFRDRYILNFWKPLKFEFLKTVKIWIFENRYNLNFWKPLNRKLIKFWKKNLILIITLSQQFPTLDYHILTKFHSTFPIPKKALFFLPSFSFFFAFHFSFRTLTEWGIMEWM